MTHFLEDMSLVPAGKRTALSGLSSHFGSPDKHIAIVTRDAEIEQALEMHLVLLEAFLTQP